MSNVSTSGILYFSDLKQVFGGSDILFASDYFQNSSKQFTKDIQGIPNAGTIFNLGVFRGKGRPANGLYTFTSHTFTNAGATGRSGPTLSQVKSEYSSVSWTQNSQYLNMTSQGIQEWTVPSTGTYQIEAFGASGGVASGQTSSKGARMRGDFNLTAGNVVRIVVGQQGINTSCPGGGGGSYVYLNSSTPYIIAGGGGGVTSNHSSDANGQSGENAGRARHNNGEYEANYLGLPGQHVGVGHGSWITSTRYQCSGGGAGWLSVGAESHHGSSQGNTPVKTGGNTCGTCGTSSGGQHVGSGAPFIGGQASCCGAADGGFGGAGGGGCCGEGGGGGYTGGAGTYASNSHGGGAGSYNSGLNQSNSSGANLGNGQVVITPLFVITVANAGTYSFTNHTFTNATTVGVSGPTLQSCLTAYSSASWTSNIGNFNVTTGIQLWRVPTTGTYRILTNGAQGGSVTNQLASASADFIGTGSFTNQSHHPGALAARMRGDFSLTSGEWVAILVGQMGTSKIMQDWGGGGGGASYVVRLTSINTGFYNNTLSSWVSPLIVAAGGGGAGDNNVFTQPTAGSGITTTSTTGGSSSSAGGGGGFVSDGAADWNNAQAKSFLNGGVGGGATSPAPGGFGGGGSPYDGGGGGGGYMGGNTLNNIGGNGGTSFNVGSNAVNETGVNSGHGSVSIQLL